MYTNTALFGGNFRPILDKEFSNSSSVTIASGYASLDVINDFHPRFVEIAKNGGTSRLLLGMAFYEGLGQKKLKALTSLNKDLSRYNNDNGVFVSNGRRYHGKVYKFINNEGHNYFVGSSNFSSSGTKGNIECTLPIIEAGQKIVLNRFLDELFSSSNSLKIDKAAITVPGKKKTVLKTVENFWEALKRYDPNTITKSSLPRFIFPLERIASKEKSNLNVYFGKGRLNSSTGIVSPRPWYEIELIASNDLNSQSNYPIGDFDAYTDDGYIIPMRTQGANNKNIRSKDSLQIFGIWLKGKLERSGVLKKFEPVTSEILEEYGSTQLVFYKISGKKYYMEFIPQ